MYILPLQDPFFNIGRKSRRTQKTVYEKQAARGIPDGPWDAREWWISKGGNGSFSGIHHIVISFLPLILKKTASAMIVENVRIAEMAEATLSLPRMICE